MIFSFFFNDTATTEIYTLSLHDALPISKIIRALEAHGIDTLVDGAHAPGAVPLDIGLLRPAYRSEEHSLNSSHQIISYAVFCLKKKNQPSRTNQRSESYDGSSADRSDGS